MVILQIQAPMTDDELRGILAAGSLGVSDERAREIGQAIATAGAMYIHAVIARNEPDARADMRRMQRASIALAAAIDALGPPSLMSGGDTSPDAILLDPRGHVHQRLTAEFSRARHGFDETVAAADHVTSLLDGLVRLRALVDQSMRQITFEISRSPRSSRERASLARALTGRLPPHVPTRRDNALEHFLRSVWESYLLAAEKLPKTSIGAPGRHNEGHASGIYAVRSVRRAAKRKTLRVSCVMWWFGIGPTFFGRHGKHLPHGPRGLVAPRRIAQTSLGGEVKEHHGGDRRHPFSR
jgi:hypothetical protein